MRWLNRLEARYGNYGVPNVTVVLIVLQVFVYVVNELQEDLIARIQLVPALVLDGQWWRVLTFMCTPPITNPIFAFFFWYLFYLMGTVLESNWGALKYNVFLLIGYVATVAVAFMTPGAVATNGFLQGSVFLAFAYLYPDFQLALFFILPVKIKWLARIAWIFYFYEAVTGGWSTRLLVLASVVNFLVFFAADIVDRVRTGRRHMAFQARRLHKRDDSRPFHRCVVCGITDKSHPNMDFRYCTKCLGAACYCREHLHQHEHITEHAPPQKA